MGRDSGDSRALLTQVSLSPPLAAVASGGPRRTCSDSWARSRSRVEQTVLLDSLTGVPVGVMGLLVQHGVRFTIGIGAFLFKLDR